MRLELTILKGFLFCFIFETDDNGRWLFCDFQLSVLCNHKKSLSVDRSREHDCDRLPDRNLEVVIVCCRIILPSKPVSDNTFASVQWRTT